MKPLATQLPLPQPAIARSSPGPTASAQDIEIAQLREELRKNAALLAAKNAELEAFTYSVSHDLTEPLRSVETFSSFLLDDYRALLPEEAQDHIDRISRASIRMKSMINDLLHLSRMARMAKDPVPMELGPAIDDAIRAVHKRVTDSGATIAVAEDLPVVFADDARLQQILTNVIDNGLKYNHNVPPIIEIGVRACSPEEVTLFVRDNGIGISEEFQEKIFGLFQRLHGRDEYGGTGAGLAIVKRAIETLNGRISVESEGDAGSTFLITLPAPPAAAQEEAA